MSKTNIEWTEKTWNPITGCTKYSKGCKNCYAEKMTKRLTAMGQKKYAAGFNNVVFHKEELKRNLGVKPKMIFVNSMSDTFHNDVENWQIQEILNYCTYFNSQHTYQILTKRSERLKDFSFNSAGYDNIWLGVTVEHSNYKHRIDDLRKTDAKIKFLSCEPLLGDLGELDLTGIDWVIVGGESGPNARPMHPDWVNKIEDQCIEQNVPFFFKQWGEWSPLSSDVYKYIENVKAKYVWNDGSIHDDYNEKWDWESNPRPMYKIGKKKSGSLIYGKEYKEWPKAVQI